MLNLTGSRMKALKMQNLSQMNITNFEHQKVRLERTLVSLFVFYASNLYIFSHF